MGGTPTAVEAVRETVALARERAQASGRPVIASLALPASEAEPLALLEPPIAGWWREPGLEVAGAGAAVEIRATGPGRFEDLSVALRSIFGDAAMAGRAPLALIGAAFRDREGTEAWEGFPSATAWIPQRSIIRDDEESWLVGATLVAAVDIDPEERLSHALTASSLEVPTATEFEDGGKFDTSDRHWRHAVRDTVKLIDGGGLEKAVLARRYRIEGKHFSAPALASHLSNQYPDCFGYAFVRNESAFAGASPEPLVEVRGTDVRSVPEAGTVANDPDGDGLDSEKMRHEQALVVASVTESLRPWCSELHEGSTEKIEAGPVRHLATRIEGTLSRPAHLLELAAALHPTPAVAGLPRDAALEQIERVEQFERGWYSGAVGAVDRDGNGTLAVALRGALMHPAGIDLFAGAGVVRGSEPEEELEEVALKLRAISTALNEGPA
ncbi:MAG: isochorismate synthase [Actinomycetota bacterium]